MNQELEQFEAKLTRGEELDNIGRILELSLNQTKNLEDRSIRLYLLGVILAKKNQPDNAIKVLEEAIQQDNVNAKAYFLLFKLYRNKNNTTKALSCLEKCIESKYKSKYCQKMQIKIAYSTKNFINANNYLIDYQDQLVPNFLGKVLRIECLLRLKLYDEADRNYQQLLQSNKCSITIRQWLDDLFHSPEETQYQIKYKNNLQFFKERGDSFQSFSEVNYKVSNFLGKEFVYDCSTGYFIAKLPEDAPGVKSSLKVEMDDILAIYHSDDIRVFKQLYNILTEVNTKQYKKRVSAIPVFIIEQNTTNWELIMQVFDFTSLQEWQNLHFMIGKSSREIQTVFLEEATPLPTLFYGTDLEVFRELLMEVQTVKDEKYQQRLGQLHEYYQSITIGTPNKILIFTSIHNDALLYYGTLLKDYLVEKGYQCTLYQESQDYQKFTKYQDVKLLEELHPDLVISLFTIRGEMAVFNSLNLPFLSWFVFNKKINLDFLDAENQFMVLTGNLNEKNYLVKKGYHEERILEVPLPVRRVENLNEVTEIGINDIGIIADLDDIDLIINNIVNIVYGAMTTKHLISKEDFSAVIKTVYFDIYTLRMNNNFTRPGSEVYYQLVTDNFNKRNVKFDEESIKVISDLFKKELEDSLLKMLQVSWLINHMEGYGLEIYGEGWEKSPNFQPFHEGKVDFFNDLENYQRIMLRNKINLYIGSRINNDSYLQPDLINGIALGSFFLINDLLVKEYGRAVLGPFADQLLTYGSREEMLEKLKYYLAHNDERLAKAKQLQSYVLRQFDIEKVAQAILNLVKGGLKDNLN